MLGKIAAHIPFYDTKGHNMGKRSHKAPPKDMKAKMQGNTHINAPKRKKAPLHDSVKKATRARATKRAEDLNAALPDRASGPRPGTVTAKQLTRPNNVDQFGNPLSPNNDSFFDEGATAQ